MRGRRRNLVRTAFRDPEMNVIHVTPERGSALVVNPRKFWHSVYIAIDRQAHLAPAEAPADDTKASPKQHKGPWDGVRTAGWRDGR